MMIAMLLFPAARYGVSFTVDLHAVPAQMLIGANASAFEPEEASRVSMMSSDLMMICDTVDLIYNCIYAQDCF